MDDDWIAGSHTGNWIEGDDGDDYLYGGDGVDAIWGDDSNYFSSGGTGDDYIDCGGGSDVARTGPAGAGPGKDTVHGDFNSAFVIGPSNLLGNPNTQSVSDGSDDIYGSTGDDDFFGHGGDDNLYCDDGIDIVSGGTGNDLIFGGPGGDDLAGDAGMDDIYGGSGDDVIEGGANDDYLLGGGDDDTIYGGTASSATGSGDDAMDGEAGVDALFGQDGRDFLHDDDDVSVDTLNGGADPDQIHSVNGAGMNAVDIVVGGAANDFGWYDSGHDDDSAGDIEYFNTPSGGPAGYNPFISMPFSDYASWDFNTGQSVATNDFWGTSGFAYIRT